MIVRFGTPTGSALGYLAEGFVHLLPFRSIGEFARTDGAWSWSESTRRSLGTFDPRELELLAPVDDYMEVWGAGVTYLRSLEAREEESESSRDIYSRVYDAPRPELFFKGLGWRAGGSGSVVTLRTDSYNCVPEPELALLVSPTGAIAGLTVCNDLTARDIESENPLYLPQAKIWLGSCILGPGIVPTREISDPYALEITMSIVRGSDTVFEGSSNTARLRRRLDELALAALRDQPQPNGFLLSTGTPIVPPWEFALAAGDTVSITIESVGTLSHSIGLPDHAPSTDLRP